MKLLEEIKALREEFEEINERYKSDRSLFPRLQQIVREIETKQKQYDNESGFSRAQQQVHDLCIKVPSSADRIGSIDNKDASNIINTTQEMLNSIQPNNNSVEFSLVGLSPGSTVLLYDIVEKDTPVRMYNRNDTKTKLTSVLQEISSLKEESFNKESLERIEESTGLLQHQIYDVAKSILKITPSRDDEIDSIQISINNDDVETKIESKKSDRLIITKSKQKIYGIIKPEEETILEGQLGIMEEWDINHKIVIIDDEKRKHTINYTPTDENKDRIKEYIGDNVKIRRERDVADKRKWLLVDWID